MRAGLLTLTLGLVLVLPCRGLAAETVAFWHFGSEETTRLESHGGVHRDQPGPRPPLYPDFTPGNTAVRLDGKGAHFRFADPGDESPFDFTLGDTITLEACVNLAEIRTGENLYVIGKGRTHSRGFARDNQNWALRVREVKGSVRVSFLFFSAPDKGWKGAWHRWTSDEGFRAGSGWHHLAVSYTFGKSASVRGWLDGKPLTGTWDMGGATDRAPVVDNDAIWIGSSQGGNAGNSFRGLLDEIAIHRGILSEATLRSRYRRSQPAPAEQERLLAASPPTPGKVTVTCYEGLAAHDRWPDEAEQLARPIIHWETDRFLFPRLPTRYEAGMRAAWAQTVLLRASALVTLPAGRHQLLVRARGGARVWLDGKVVARTAFQKAGADGHGKVPAEPAEPAPGARLVRYGDREQIVEISTPEGVHTLVLEVLAGSKRFRAETGECCLAVRLAGDSQFRVLGAGQSEPTWLTDEDWEVARLRQEAALEALDTRTRRASAAQDDSYWQARHQHARDWAQRNVPAIPEGESRWPVTNPIDRFLGVHATKALAASKADAGSAEFHARVLPILRDQCFRCHGDKDRGGLRLNSREAALAAGDSGRPAIVPGKPDRSELLARIHARGESRMPPTGPGLTPAQRGILETWIRDGANWPAPPVSAEEVTPRPVVSDSAFLRRIYLDTVGVPPSPAEARAFLADRSPDRRGRLVDQLLRDPRGADHWVSYWQDVLAENPNLLKPTLNNTGPFRFFLHDALRDHLPMDRLVTELILMRGGSMTGGSAGFGLAAENDVPMAAKAHILGTAFLGVEMGCARCHDAPFHATRQRDLFSLAAMLQRKTLRLPTTSSVPAAFFDRKTRPSLIKASLRPGETIAPVWPFPDLGPTTIPAGLLRKPDDSRERLAATVTLPENRRFAEVLVNRVWKRLMGAGIVEPVHDWEGRSASHPELLRWLAHQLVEHEYRLEHVVRLILTSNAYQRKARGDSSKTVPERRFFAGPDLRRLSAEQIVDGLFAAAGKSMRTEELTLDSDGTMQPDRFLNFGQPRRAWQFTALANERDRPSLSLPRAQAVADVLEAFGWTGSRQAPLSERETEPGVLQPGALANGALAIWISRLSDDAALTEDALSARSPGDLADTVFLRFLTRLPTPAERARLVALLEPGFATRLVAGRPGRTADWRMPRVSWDNHLSEEANRQMLVYGRAARFGPPPTARLRAEWRERLEDAVWSVFNLPEFVWVP